MLNNFFSLSIVLYPILSAYRVANGLDLGVVMCTIFGTLAFAQGKIKRLSIPDGFIVFLCYVVFSAIIITKSFPFRLILYFFILLIACTICQFNNLYQYYKKIAIVCIIFFVIQEIVRNVIGYNIPGIFSFLPTIYGDTSVFIDNSIVGSVRSCSFFLEPSYFAQFLFPLIVVELFCGNSKTNMSTAIVLTLITILIRSGNGILLILIIWTIWLFVSEIKISKKISVVIFAIIGLSIVPILFPDLITSLIERSSELNMNGVDEKWQTSGFIRFYRGYYLYDILPTINKFFGINSDELDRYMYLTGLFLTENSFLNGVQTILCLYGLAGLCFFFYHIIILGKKSNMACVVILSGIVYLLFSESYFICSRMLLAIVLVYKLKYENFICDKFLP